MKLLPDSRFLLLACLLAACEPLRGGAAASIECRIVQPPVPLPAELTEASGVVVSSVSPEMVWTHNDSGTRTTLFGVDHSGRLLQRVTITPATVRLQDWEDTALAPCDGGTCLFLGDIGDNSAERATITIHRLREPAPRDTTAPILASYPARYPGGARDTEALFALPDGRVFLVSKGENSPIELYALPEAARPGETVALTLVSQLSDGLVPLEDRVTGASATSDGRWVGLRTRTSLIIYSTESLLSGGQPAARVHLTPLQEPQGEGVGFGTEGTVVLTSEGGGGGVPGSISVVQCPQLVD